LATTYKGAATIGWVESDVVVHDHLVQVGLAAVSRLLEAAHALVNHVGVTRHFGDQIVLDCLESQLVVAAVAGLLSARRSQAKRKRKGEMDSRLSIESGTAKTKQNKTKHDGSCASHVVSVV
jgi:hypothetical protein